MDVIGAIIAEIIEDIIENKLKVRITHDHEAIPLLFFFRHCLELYLKGLNYYLNFLGGNIKVRKKGKEAHDIIIPFKEILNLKERFGIREPNFNVKAFIEKIENLDSTGQGWRYPESSKGVYNKKQEEFATSLIYDNNNQILKNIKETLNWCINIEADLDSYMENLGEY